jgi:hypothetical protein
MSDDATGGMGSSMHPWLGFTRWSQQVGKSQPIEPAFLKVQHFLHNVNATIDSSIEICQGVRSLIVSWMGSMMVVTNPMDVKCSLLARSPPRIKARQMAAIQPMTGVMAMCEWSQPPSMVMAEGSARRNGMQSGPTTIVANQMVVDMLTCVESAQDQVQTNGRHSSK